NEAARARIDLMLALGLAPGTPLAAELPPGDPVSTSEPLPADAEAAVAFALERRGDLRAEAARRLHARAEHASVRMERLPRLEVVADYGFNGPRVDEMLRTQTVNLQLSLPLLDGLRHEGRRTERTVALREAELREAELARLIEAEVRRALLDVASAREQEESAEAQLRLAHEEVAQARRAYGMGVGSSLEVVSAQVSLGQAEDAVIDARFALARAQVERASAMGVATTLR
ncbi:MAG TPA: TolC family protein, partial [Longimicrobiaceae bacterium]|nr:TolC family protein [Longimicrobiaceae bacterium]